MQTAVEWLIDKIVQDQMYKAISQKEWIEIFEQAKEMESSILDKANELQSSQTEISDDEIEKIINPNKLEKIPESWKSFIDGAKWYREQLKNNDKRTNYRTN